MQGQAPDRRPAEMPTLFLRAMTTLTLIAFAKLVVAAPEIVWQVHAIAYMGGWIS